MAQRTCSFGACPKPAVRRTWCWTHYGRWRRHGDPGLEARRPAPSVRFWRYVDKDGPGGCWLWTGTCYPNGYGQFLVDGHRTGPHRFAYELLVGPIPEGLQMDHLCNVRNCVNPGHLEAVTFEENCRRRDERRVLA